MPPASAVEQPSVFQDQIKVTVGADDFVFRAPSIRYDIEVAAKAAAIRRKADPEAASPYEIGAAAVRFSYALAVMELYLIASTATWPFSPGPAGKPIVDHEKFSPKKARAVYQIGDAFEAEYGRFREDGTAGDDAAGAEAVAGS